MNEVAILLKLYLPLVSGVGLGIGLGRLLPPSIPARLGKFLFWIGVPIGIPIFLRQADLSGAVWLAPLVAWIALILGAGLGWLWITVTRKATTPVTASPLYRSATQGSFLLATMVGNTGYLGYPVALAIVGQSYFGWAVFYDTLGSTLGAYGLGVLLAARLGDRPLQSEWYQTILHNPVLWSFGLGLVTRQIPLPAPVETGLAAIGWGVIGLSLLLLGMRLGQITPWRNLQPAAISLGIKMLTVPLLVGIGLSSLGLTGAPLLVLVLQAAMPPAFATLVIAEAYDLDRDLTVTTLALGSLILLLTVPLWLWLFG